MNLQRKPLEFYNLIKKKVNDEEVFSKNIDIKMLQRGVYPTGPIIVEGKWQVGDTYFLLPLNTKVKVEGDFDLLEKLYVEDGIYQRCGEEKVVEESLFILVRKIADDMGVELADNYYKIILNVYGGTMVDFYVPIRGKKNDQIG